MPFNPNSDYAPPRLFRNCHINTLYPALFRKVKGVDCQRVRLETPDDDFVDLDWSFAKPTADSDTTQRKLLVCVHGLEGNAQRPYMRAMMRRFNTEGFDAVGLNLRSCSGEMNRRLDGYHSGRTDDLHLLIKSIVADGKYSDITLVGFSVGGNIALKYGGEMGENLPAEVRRIIAFSVTCDLEASSLELEKPRNRFYQWQFLVTLKRKVRLKAARFPNRFDLDKVLKANTFRQFDDHFTAPIHGYCDASDYWTNASSLPFLEKITVPTLLVNALDDTFLAPPCFPFELAKRSTTFHLETPKYGGHLGFMSPDTEGYIWTERRAWAFFKQTEF